MKKERYFRDELQRLFFIYGAVPAALFTLICALVFMTVLLQGRMKTNQERCLAAAGQMERLLDAYEDCISELSAVDGILEAGRDEEKRSQVFEIFYSSVNEAGLRAELYILDHAKGLAAGSKKELPPYLMSKPGITWGIFYAMEQAPGQTVTRLLQGWDGMKSCVVMGRQTGDGYVLLSLEGSRLNAMVDMQDVQLIVADRFGWVLFGSYNHFLTASNQVGPVLKQGASCLMDEGRVYLSTSRPVRGGEFMVYSVTDIQNILVSLGIGSGLVITAFLLMTLWIFFSSRKVTEKKTQDLYHILDALKEAREGNLEGTIEIKRDNEFKLIADAYNETIESLKGQMERNRDMAELLAMAQNKQLASQFNPHFLYNTLENIRYMCRLDPATADRMVFCLSNLLRYSLEAGKAEVTLKEDLEHLKNYLSILEMRFASRFVCHIQVEPEAMDCRIPRLIFQPMIENAVKYGYGNQLKLEVELKAYVHEGQLVMICRDDGVGMSPALLGELTALLEQKENTSRHSGIYNIHRRILLRYGRPYGVELRSAEGHGTTLVVSMPARKWEE